ELGDEVVRDLFGAAGQPAAVHAGHGVGDGLAQPQVLGAVAEHGVGAVGEERDDGAVGRDEPLVEVPPVARVLAEGGVVLEQVQGRGVVGDERGVDSGGEFDGRDGAVVPQVRVVRLGGGGEVRTVQGYPPVSGTSGRGHRSGGVGVQGLLAPVEARSNGGTGGGC